ncbi:MAG: alkaline phosphatase family protein, partial [Actinomycetota bacterium]|nr:alkaline phosphatase family protein [Actinomycetota bacterium]
MHGTERTELLTPSYAVSLASVLPSVAASLGVAVGATGASGSSRRTGDRPGCAELIDLPPARGAVVVLVDGLGAEQLQRRGGHAPFLRTLVSPVQDLTCGFPSTTATSMGSFGTGLPPGVHGMVGWQVLMPGRDRLLNQLSWHEGPDPFAWQPHGTVFEQVAAAGLPVTRVGPAHFEASGLTRAALRGGRFAVARRPAERVTAALAALARDPRALVYLYWGEVDKTGHEHGPDSWQWGEQVEAVDTQLA